MPPKDTPTPKEKAKDVEALAVFLRSVGLSSILPTFLVKARRRREREREERVFG